MKSKRSHTIMMRIATGAAFTWSRARDLGATTSPGQRTAVIEGGSTKQRGHKYNAADAPINSRWQPLFYARYTRLRTRLCTGLYEKNIALVKQAWLFGCLLTHIQHQAVTSKDKRRPLGQKYSLRTSYPRLISRSVTSAKNNAHHIIHTIQHPRSRTENAAGEPLYRCSLILEQSAP